MIDADALVEGFAAAGFSRKTIINYVNALRGADRWLDAHGHDVATVGPLAVREYAETLPRTRSSRALLRSALGALWRAQGRLDGPVGAIRVPTKPRMRCRALEDHQAAVLAAAARRRGDRKGAATLLGLYAGLRRAEISALEWKSVGADGWLTVVGKGDVTRSMPLHPVVVAALHALPRRGRYVFPGRFGGPMNPTTIWLWVREVAEDAGLEAVPTHVLRHTALATALDGCRDLRAVQELAGHARPETTAGYTRTTRARLISAVQSIDYEEAS